MSSIGSVLDSIGNTPIVQLQRIVPRGSARLLAKLEWANPTGSMKDRMAKAVIEGAEARGLLKPGATAVEYTAGTTGVSLALIDGILTVSTEEAKAMARRIAREEGLFAGTSSGANVVAALRVAQRLGPEATVVTLMIDSGLKYLSADLY